MINAYYLFSLNPSTFSIITIFLMIVSISTPYFPSGSICTAAFNHLGHSSYSIGLICLTSSSPSPSCTPYSTPWDASLSFSCPMQSPPSISLPEAPSGNSHPSPLSPSSLPPSYLFPIPSSSSELSPSPISIFPDSWGPPLLVPMFPYSLSYLYCIRHTCATHSQLCSIN